MLNSFVIIDAQNTYSATRAIGKSMDWKELHKWFDTDGLRLLRASFYIAEVEDDNGNVPSRKLTDWLAYNGYNVVKKFSHASRIDPKVPRASMAVEIAIDALEVAPYVQEVFLFSGSGDYIALVHSLQRRGLRVTVCSVRAEGICSEELKKQADEFVDLGARDDFPFLKNADDETLNKKD